MTNVEIDLPKNARTLCRLLGIATALKVVEKWGGTAMYVPKEIPPEHDIAQLVGVVNAAKIAAEFGPAHVKIERCAKLFRRQRDERIKAAFTEGTSAAKLAREYEMDERHIFRILNGRHQAALCANCRARMQPKRRRSDGSNQGNLL